MHGLYWLSSNVAEDGPVLLVLDDAHWADVASLRWLAYLARRIEELPIMLALGVGPRDGLADDRLLAGRCARFVRRARPRDDAWISWDKGPVVVTPPPEHDLTAFRDPTVFWDRSTWRLRGPSASPFSAALSLA